MNTRFTATVTLASLGLLFSLHHSASAQNALGTGNALDRNLGVGTGGINQGTRVENYRDRNLVITGDVAGGRGFRGTVGYRAPSDFSGHLGSNDLFGFRADSAFSSPDLIRMGNTFEQLRFGQDNGSVVEYRRSGSGESPGLILPDPSTANTSSAKRRIDRTALVLSTQAALDQSVEPRVIGAAQSDENKMVFFNASTVRGLTVERADQSVGLIGLTSFDAARLRKDLEGGKKSPELGAPFEARFGAAKGDEAKVEDTKVDASVQADKVSAPVETDYKKILDRIADRYAQQENVDVRLSPELLDRLNNDYKDIKEKLSGKISSTTGPQSVGGKDESKVESSSLSPSERDLRNPSANPSKNPLAPPGATREPGAKSPSAPDATGKPPALNPLNPDQSQHKPSAMEQYGGLLRHGERVTKLSGADQSRFNELMSSAEQRLRDGDYFWAERRFERALRFTPGHPMATIGVAHSQLGAGLYLSASYTLRNLFTNSPEMIDTIYAPELLPAPAKLDEAVGRIKTLLEGEKERASYAFLLAYIGHQTSKRDLVEQGLKVMGDIEPDNALLALVKSIWLGDKNQAPPAKAPVSPTPATTPTDPGK